MNFNIIDSGGNRDGFEPSFSLHTLISNALYQLS